MTHVYPDNDILFPPYSTFIRELWNNEKQLKGGMKPREVWSWVKNHHDEVQNMMKVNKKKKVKNVNVKKKVKKKVIKAKKVMKVTTASKTAKTAKVEKAKKTKAKNAMKVKKAKKDQP